MLNAFTQNWWAWALRGVAALLFWIGVLIWPGAGLAVLVALFGAFGGLLLCVSLYGPLGEPNSI